MIASMERKACMKKTLQIFGLYLIISLLILFLLPLICGNIILTVFNGIFGPENGLWITNLFMRVCFPVITAAIIFVIKFKNSEDKRNYLKSMEGLEYDAKKMLTAY